MHSLEDWNQSCILNVSNAHWPKRSQYRQNFCCDVLRIHPSVIPVWFRPDLLCLPSVAPSEKVKMSWSVALKLLHKNGGAEASSNHSGAAFLRSALDYPDGVRVRMQHFQWQIAVFFCSLSTAFRVREKDIQALVLRTKRDSVSVLRIISRHSGGSVG